MTTENRFTPCDEATYVPTKCDNQELHKRKRDEFIVGELTSDEYHCWLADFIGLGEENIPTSTSNLLESTAHKFNDIPLTSWESGHCTAQRLAFAKGLSWSKADSVSCLKAISHRLVLRIRPAPANWSARD